MSILRLLGMLFRVLLMSSRHKKAMANLRSSSERLAAHNRMMDAYRRGDYVTALRELELRKDDDKQAYCFFRGSFLMQLGQVEEAEQLLRQNVLIESREHQAALGYSSLGQLMLGRGRYDEAMECFTASLRHMPDRGATLRDVAETWLLRSSDPAEALKWAQLAVVKEKAAPVISKEVRDLNLGEDLATLAWAVAASSHDQRAVDEIVAEALPLIETGAASSAAQVHYHSGRAYAELGDLSKSVQRFEEASRRDPNGCWGRAARAALQHANR
jgi:tetratricopeptide (TPR) repeat protein